jgi:hypothetical protein
MGLGRLRLARLPILFDLTKFNDRQYFEMKVINCCRLIVPYSVLQRYNIGTLYGDPFNHHSVRLETQLKCLELNATITLLTKALR